jgi:methylmalonyl-CoA mutase cobalamin-binding domain/chain
MDAPDCGHLLRTPREIVVFLIRRDRLTPDWATPTGTFAARRNGAMVWAPGRMNVVGEGERPLRVLVAKVGLDGHDRGLRVVARILRDAGFEVVYAGLRQSPESIVAMTIQEDADVVGVSMHNGAHLTLAPAVVRALLGAGLNTPVVVGGIVPPTDVPVLAREGVAAVLGPGASNNEVVASVRSAATSVRG